MVDSLLFMEDSSVSWFMVYSLLFMEDSGEIRDIAISKLSKLRTDNYSTIQLFYYFTILLLY